MRCALGLFISSSLHLSLSLPHPVSSIVVRVCARSALALPFTWLFSLRITLHSCTPLPLQSERRERDTRAPCQLTVLYLIPLSFSLSSSMALCTDVLFLHCSSCITCVWTNSEECLRHFLSSVHRVRWVKERLWREKTSVSAWKQHALIHIVISYEEKRERKKE